MKDQPDLSAVPREVRRLLEACLQTDPRKRLQAIGDWKLLLNRSEFTAAARAAPQSRTRWLWPALATALALSTALLAFVHFRESPPPADVLRFTVNLPGNGFLALSPDGRRLVVGTNTEERTVFAPDGCNATPLAGGILGRTDTVLVPRQPLHRVDGCGSDALSPRKRTAAKTAT